MEIIRRDSAKEGPARPPTERRTATFTGTVYGDPLLDGSEGAAVTSVFFAPGARTFWHSHEHGQILTVVSGRGLICQHGSEIEVLNAGDLAWSPPGELHWHGAAPATSVLHRAISLGLTTWASHVSDEEYEALRAIGRES